jgi:hypothetical protein
VRALLFLLAVAWQDPQPVIRDVSHPSQVLGADRRYIAVLPPSYAASQQKRYPVLYWLYGYEQTDDNRTREITAYAAAHEFIVVSAGPVETTGEFPLYFPELVEHVDRTFRTVPSRDRRAVAGAAMGGFLSIWTAGKFPDLVASAAALQPFAEAPVGPKGFPSDSSITDHFNHEGVRTLQTETIAPILQFISAGFETPAKTATNPPAPGPRPPAPVAAPGPRPPAPVFSHSDPYPNFTLWGWDVASDRRQPGFTILENVSPRGFRSSVREWVPGGAVLSAVKLSISSPPRSYPAGSAQTVQYIRLRDRNVRRATQKADAQGRLSFDLDGDVYEVGVSAEPLLTVSGYDFADSPWATAGKPVTLRLTFWNKGAARSSSLALRWESATPGISFGEPSTRMFALAPGESATVPLTFTARSPGIARIVAADGNNRMPIDVIIHPPADPAVLFQIADGVTVSAWRHGTLQADTAVGEGTKDNHAAPGESFAILVPDGESLRPAELFTADPCVDNTVLASDSLGEHASLKYSLPAIRSNCEPGHVVRMLARVAIPGKAPQYWSIEFPVWFRQ